jgi:hypothetical protein
MKLSALLAGILIFTASFATAQDKTPSLDKSPLDISYCPNNYPILKVQQKTKAPLIARLIYSRPAMQGRKIFGELIEYGKVWRMGANESTEIEFYKDVIFGKTRLKKGRYSLYMLPTTGKWTFIINKETDSWGAFAYDNKKDLIRMDVNPQSTTAAVENLSVYFDECGTGCYTINILWENTQVAVPFQLAK